MIAASIYLYGSKDAQVAGGSFDLSTACPAGYVSRSCRGPPSVFSPAEGILLPRRFKGGRGPGSPAPTRAIHFAASERMGELISDISWGKRFYARRDMDGSGTEGRHPRNGKTGRERERDI